MYSQMQVSSWQFKETKKKNLSLDTFLLPKNRDHMQFDG